MIRTFSKTRRDFVQTYRKANCVTEGSNPEGPQGQEPSSGAMIGTHVKSTLSGARFAEYFDVRECPVWWTRQVSNTRPSDHAVASKSSVIRTKCAAWTDRVGRGAPLRFAGGQARDASAAPRRRARGNVQRRCDQLGSV